MAVVLAALVTAAALLGGLYVAFTSDMRAQLRGEIHADVEATLAADRILPAVAALTVLDRQSDHAGRTGPLYLLIDPETHRPLAGNLARWPDVHTGPDGCGSVEGSGSERPMIACITRVDGHFPLLIARSTTGIGSTRGWMLWGYVVLALVVIIAGATAGWLRLSQLNVRLAGIQAALDGFAKGDLGRRPPVDGNDLVGRLSSGVRRALDELEQAITGQHVIADRIAHDLKRPVAIALGTLDLKRPATEALATCRDHLAELNRIIDGILRISEVAMRDEPLEPVMVDIAARDVAELYCEAAALRDIVIVVNADPVKVMGRRELIDRLLANLIDNAVKYTAPATTVLIEVAIEEASALIRITDGGPGMAGLPAQYGTYFARGPAAAGVAGSGLGLAAVRRIVELSKGGLHLADRVDGLGLCVEVRIQLGVPPAS